MPDELCEVAEICSGTSLISSAIISCRVHHLRELGRKNKVVVDVFLILLYTPRLDRASLP